MFGPNSALHEQAKIVWGMGPKVPSTTVPDYVSLKNYSRCCVIITGLNTTTVTGSAITLKQATAVANTGEKALAFDKVFANLDVTASDTLVETAVTSNTFTTAATNSINFMYVIDVTPEMLDVTNNFDCVRLGTGDATNATLSVTYILYPAKYSKATPPASITD
jgi:hypothetical protein